MEEKDKIIVKWAQEDVETSNSLLNNNNNNNNRNAIHKVDQTQTLLYIVTYGLRPFSGAFENQLLASTCLSVFLNTRVRLSQDGFS